MVLSLGVMLAVLASRAPSARAADNPLASDDASLEVIVGPGAHDLQPMAIPGAKCEGASASACAIVTHTLRRCMLISFMFKLLPPRSFLADPAAESLAAPDWKSWDNVGARWLIKAEVKGAGPYTVELRLYNVLERKVLRVKEQSFSGITEKKLRNAVHRFCNGVLEVLTGSAGVFHTRIAYAARVAPGVKAIGMVGMDGGGKTGLIGNGSINMLPSWGNGGVYYTSFLSGKPDIWKHKQRITHDAGHYRKVSVRAGKMVASIAYGGQSDIYLMSMDGRVLKNLSRSGADEVSPSISPDGSKVAFVSSRAGGLQVYTMSIGGGGATRVTHGGSYNYAPDWGPNGLIAFAGMDGGSSDIFTVTEGGSMARLTQDQGSNKDPAWSPDGRYLAFYSSRSEGRGIYLMSADGRYQYRIAKGGGRGNTAWEH